MHVTWIIRIILNIEYMTLKLSPGGTSTHDQTTTSPGPNKVGMERHSPIPHCLARRYPYSSRLRVGLDTGISGTEVDNYTRILYETSREDLGLGSRSQSSSFWCNPHASGVVLPSPCSGAGGGVSNLEPRSFLHSLDTVNCRSKETS